MIPKRKNWRSKSYLRWVRSQRCVISKLETGVQCAHVNVPGCSGMSQKAPDYLVLPVHWRIHDKWHNGGHPPIEALISLVKRLLQKAMLEGVLVGELKMEFDSIHDLVQSWSEAFETGEVYETE